MRPNEAGSEGGNLKSAAVFQKAKSGQILYDLAFVDLTDKWLARKHHIPVAEVRKLRKLPAIVRLRKQSTKLSAQRST